MDQYSIKKWLRVILELHDTGANGKSGVYQRTVDSAVKLFQCDVARLAVFEDGNLIPEATSRDEPLEISEPMPASQGIIGRTYQSGVTIRIDDLTDTRSAASSETGTNDAGPQTCIGSDQVERSLLSIPIPSCGVMQLSGSEPGAFTERDEELASLFASHVQAALDREEAEEELRNERDRYEEFANVVSHDLRNSLQILQGVLGEFEETGDHDGVERGLRTLSEMETLIDVMLLLAREDDGIEETERIALDQITRDSWEAVLTDDTTIHVRTDQYITANRSRLTQLLENLFRNANEHGGSEVAVTVGDLDDGFYIEDDGNGIPDDARHRVFEQGYSSNPSGTGIGLSIVAKVVDDHGWSVTLTESDDGGVRFEITDVEIVD